jgi:hypothetical protein
MADQFTREFTEEQMVSNHQDHVVSPAIIEEQPESAPRRLLRTRYVKRGREYLRARKMSVRVNEPVFVKEGSNYVVVGKVNRNKKLPLVFAEANAKA